MKIFNVCHSSASIKGLGNKLKSRFLTVFIAEDCPPCEGLKKTLNDYDPDYQLNIAFLNVTNNPETAMEYDVMSAPCCAVIDENGELVDKLYGFVGPEGLNVFLKKNL